MAVRNFTPPPGTLSRVPLREPDRSENDTHANAIPISRNCFDLTQEHNHWSEDSSGFAFSRGVLPLRYVKSFMIHSGILWGFTSRVGFTCVWIRHACILIGLGRTRWLLSVVSGALTCDSDDVELLRKSSASREFANTAIPELVLFFLVCRIARYCAVAVSALCSLS